MALLGGWPGVRTDRKRSRHLLKLCVVDGFPRAQYAYAELLWRDSVSHVPEYDRVSCDPTSPSR